MNRRCWHCHSSPLVDFVFDALTSILPNDYCRVNTGRSSHTLPPQCCYDALSTPSFPQITPHMHPQSCQWLLVAGSCLVWVGRSVIPTIHLDCTLPMQGDQHHVQSLAPHQQCWSYPARFIAFPVLAFSPTSSIRCTRERSQGPPCVPVLPCELSHKQCSANPTHSGRNIHRPTQ